METPANNENINKKVVLIMDMIDALINIVNGVEIENCLCGHYTQKKIMQQYVDGDFGEQFKTLDLYIDSVFLEIYDKLGENILDIVPEIFVDAKVKSEIELSDFEKVSFFLEEHKEPLEKIKGICFRDIVDLRIFLKRLYYISLLNDYELNTPVSDRIHRYFQNQALETLSGQ